MSNRDIRFIRLHPKFKLNGQSHSLDTLKGKAQIFIEEGEPYEQSVGHFILEWLNGKNYITVKTSGSTGDPKPIKITKIHMVNSAKATAKHFKLVEKTKALLCLPADYIAGKMMLVRALVLGWHIDMTQPKSNPLDNVYRRYDFCAMTPFQLDNSLSRLHLLTKLIVGGGAIDPSIIKRIQGISTKVYETYGMTETVTHIAARRVNPKKDKEQPVPFKALSKVSLDIDERGCLIVKAPAVSNDPVVTNDLIDLKTYKKFIWLGRIDNVINSGGIKLYPEQIEKKLALFMESPYFIAGVADTSLGEKVALFVEANDPFNLKKSDCDPELFDPYEFPKVIYTLPQFERTKTGKIKRGQTVKKWIREGLIT